MSDISVIVGTYGSDEWRKKAERALASVENQTLTPVDVIHIHGDTLAGARNEGAERASGDFLVFLDADDELDEQYVDAMSEVASEGCLHQPATLGIVNGVPDDEAVLIPERPLWTGNFLVIGTMIPRRTFLDVGGFKEWEAWEDWDLFWRCWKAGAAVKQVPKAVYRVHVNPKGRNSVNPKSARRLFEAISKANKES